MCGALSGNDTRSRGVDKRLCPCGNVRMVALGVDLELLPKVCIERCEAVLAVLVSSAGVAKLRLALLLKGLFVLQDEFQQFTHVALWFGYPLRPAVFGTEERTLPLMTTKRGVVAKDGDVGAAGQVARSLAFEHVRGQNSQSSNTR